MKKKNRIKKGIAALLTGVLTFSMTAGIMPGNVLRVQAADTGSKPETVYYATKAELMDGTFAPDENGKAKKIAKLQFGNRKDGTRWLPQKWYILGADSGVQGDNTVLFAAEPMVIGSQFNSDGRDRNYKTESGTYQNGNPSTVSANHYGASELRASMQAMVQSSYSEEETYFTQEEKRLLQKTTVTTTDITNQKDYTTSDELYALKGDVGETVLRAGSRDDKVLAMDPYWQDGNYYSFWLRSAYDSGKKPAVNIARMQSQVGYCDQINASYTGTYAIRPAANLNLTEALFASTAQTSNGTALDLSKYYYDAMTLRLDGKAKRMDIGTVEYNPAQGVIKAEKGTIGNQYDNPYGDMYWEDSYGDSYYHVSLVVQGGDDANPWCYSEYIEGLKYVDVDDIQKELTEKNITTEPVDLSKCKIWLETTGWYYKLTYAVEATETTEDLDTKISWLNVWDIDAPVAGEALDTSCEIYTSGLTTGNPVVTWTPNHTTADYETAYKASVTLTPEKHYKFAEAVTSDAKINGKKTTAKINPDGTLTLTYTFPKTASNTPPPAKTYGITATAGANGSILPSGSVEVTEGGNQTFTITAAEGYEIDSVKVDGATVTVATSYTFEHVTAAHTIDATFRAISPGKDKLTSITAPAGITVANNTAYADMNLPTKVNIVTEKGTVSQAAVTWDTSTPASGSYDPAVLTEQTVTLNGTVTCPEELDANGVALTTSITITISAAGIVGAPGVSVVEGSYTENQTVTLTSTTEGAKIYYTTDGSAPELINGTPAGTTKEYNGPISITGMQGQEVQTTVRAIAIKSGMLNSEEKTFTYTIAIPNPTPTPEPDPVPVVKAPVISTQPQAATVKTGEKATFTVTATGEAMTYQWQIDRQDGKGFVYITGADKERYVSSVVDKDCNGFMYRCIISNAGGSVTTDAVTLTITSDPAPAPDPTPAPQYSILEGANSTWTQGIDGSLAIRGDGEVAKFLDVKVDGVIVDKANYTVIAGSTIVTFKPDYMQTLTVGSHTFEMIWSDGAAETNFTVNRKALDASVDTGSEPVQVTDNNKNVTEAKEENQTLDAPRTGDPVDVVLCAILLLASLAGTAGMLRRRKR